VAPASARALDHVRHLGAPLIHFGTGTSELLVAMRDVGVDVVGVDYRLPLDEANRRLGGTVPLQGNIDPALLSAPWQSSKPPSGR
jgi:uroporphyrinogen decarboxylase